MFGAGITFARLLFGDWAGFNSSAEVLAMATMTRRKSATKTRKVPYDVAATYNEFKEFEGRRYTGMKIGRRHKWYYDKGEWHEKKITPEEWQIEYAVTKRRAGKAPEGSGVPVGTEYHWYILAHQNTRKISANDYATSMTGVKFKLAHKRAGQDKWSATPRAQRNHLIKILRDLMEDLQRQADEDSKKPHARRNGLAQSDGALKPKSQVHGPKSKVQSHRGTSRKGRTGMVRHLAEARIRAASRVH
jgi:hypothetical protein